MKKIFFDTTSEKKGEKMFKHEIVTTKEGLPYWLYINKGNVVQITKHWHNSIEIDYTFKGDADYIVSGKRYHVSDNEFILINSGEVHGVENIKRVMERRSVVLLIPYENICNLYPDFENLDFKVNLAADEDYADIKQLLRGFFESSAELDTNLRKIKQLGIFYMLVEKLIEKCTKKKIKKKPSKYRSNQNEIKKIIEYMDGHYKEKLTLDIISKKFSFSKGYLAKVFKNEMGVGVIQYLQIIRLQNAFNELSNSNKSITIIADSCGFANPSSFQKLFKQTYGMSPNVYRKKIKVQ